MLKNAARAAVYLILGIPLIVIAILIARQVEYTFVLQKSFSTNNHLPLAELQQMLATNELSTRSFFLIFICFLLILCGLLIVLRGTENAFKTSKEMKVRFSLKAAYPGLIMAIAGCLFLSYSVYKSSQLQFQTTAQLLRLNKMLAHRTSTDKDSINTKEMMSSPAEKSILHEPAKVELNEITPPTPIIADQTKTKTGRTPVPEHQVKWADHLALKTVVYGYRPSPKDKERYSEIITQIQANGMVLQQQDLHWAFSFLLRAKESYEPTQEELNRYEEIIHVLLAKGKPVSTAKNFP